MSPINPMAKKLTGILSVARRVPADLAPKAPSSSSQLCVALPQGKCYRPVIVAFT